MLVNRVVPGTIKMLELAFGRVGPHPKGIGIYTKFPKRKLFQGKALSSSSAQMNWVSHDNIIIFSDGYNAVFSGFSSVDRIITPAYTDFMELDSNLNSISRNKMRLV